VNIEQQSDRLLYTLDRRPDEPRKLKPWRACVTVALEKELPDAATASAIAVRHVIGLGIMILPGREV